MFTLAQLVCCLLVPGTVALALGALRRDLVRPAGLGGGALILAALLGHFTTALTAGDALLPPRDGWHWILPGSALLILLVLVAPLGGSSSFRSRLIGGLLHGLVAALGAWLLLRPLAGLSGGVIAAWAIGLGAVTSVTSSLVQVGLAGANRSAWLGLAALAAGTAAGIVAGGSKDIGLLAGSLAAAATGAAILGGAPVGAGAIVIPLAWYTLVGLQYASLHLISAVLLAVAPATIALAAVPAVARRPWLANGLRIAAPLAVAGAAIAGGLLLQPHDDGPSY